jgi:5-methylcytosine-specific restriction endonuclease McrA
MNILVTDYYLYLYPKIIAREYLRIERWKIINDFFDALKPLYEKYHYLKFGRATIGMSQKLRIMKKTDFKCAICKADLTEKEPHIDHIIPLIKGGGNAESNLQALCWQCNLKKGTKIL